ncbi:MAG: VCBS repeat-containing protein [Ignavibacteriales bacterium]|nr:VCBS repeat-containing protein [Ignavibacteriales bacterium]
MRWRYKIFFYSAIFLFCNANTPNFAQPIKDSQETKKIYFNVFSSPSKRDITYIKMFSRNKGIAIGTYVMEFNGKAWNLVQKKSELNSIRGAFAKDENHIYLTKRIYPMNSSELLYFDGNTWRKIYNPFSNEIFCIHVTNKNNVWLGGDREISFRKNIKWTNLPYPPNFLSVVQIFGNNEFQVWARTNDNNLFFFNNSEWTQHFQNKSVVSVDFENVNHGFALVDKEMFEFKKGNWKAHSTDESLKHVRIIYFQKPNRIWGLGDKGFVILYDGMKWLKFDFPIKENLKSISFISDDEGWISGDNGTLVHFSSKVIPHSEQIKLGFKAVIPFPYAKNLDDEYGVAIDDINGDGLRDIYSVCLYNPNRLYINDSDKVSVTNALFMDEAAKRNANGVSESEIINYIPKLHLGAGLADIDNDGDPDIYICSLNEPNKLLINDSRGFFRDVSRQSNRATDISERTNCAIFGDVNNDGNLDLFITNEFLTNRLFINDGNGYFKEVTKDAGLTSVGGSMGASFADIDGDGLLDLFVANWARTNNLYKNISKKNGEVKFMDITNKAGVGGKPYTKSNGVCFADYNNDGLLDLFVTNRGASNRLYKSKGDDTFEDVTEQVIGLDSMLSYGASFADFDNDGFLDLYVANVGENVLYKNLNGKKFVDVTIKYGAELSGYCTGTATGDIDNDGDIDLYCANYTNGNSTLFVNTIDDKNFITIDIKGTISNRDAIGAKVWLYSAGHAEDKKYLLGFREINGGNSYGSKSSTLVHFGANANQTYDIVIFFPTSGIKKVLTSIKAGSHNKVFEEEGFSKTVTYFKKSLLRFFENRENQIEFLKFFIVVLLVIFSINRGKKKYNWNIGFSVISHGIVVASYITLIFLLLYKEFSLSTILPLSFVVIYIFLLHLIFERIVFAKRIREEKQKARDKIARDLHDDLASTLSSGLIYADALARSMKSEKQKGIDLADKVKSLLNEATESITDLVWTVSPSHDKLKDLIARLRLFITESCKTNNILCEIKIDSLENDFSISGEVRKNIYLIFKEAMNNIIQHANAKDVIFSVQHYKDGFDISLQDDGIGFKMDKFQLDKESFTDVENIGSLHGNGILNMLKRAHELNAKLKIDSTKDSGTKILLKINLSTAR